MNEEIGAKDVHQICTKHKIEVKELKSLVGSFDKKIFFINNEFLLRVSQASMALEQEKGRHLQGTRESGRDHSSAQGFRVQGVLREF